MKRTSLYNIYPSLYENLQAIIDDIPRIKDMNFQGVWLNPLFESSTVPSPKTGKFGSPYGPQSFKVDRRYTDGEQLSHENSTKAVRELTDALRDAGLRVQSDVVFLHVAHSHPLINNDHEAFKDCPVLSKIPEDVDTKRWFKHGHTQSMAGDIWDDVIPFNYEDPQIRAEIMEYYLKPYVHQIIKEWGFDGLRIDSAGLVPKVIYDDLIWYAQSLCQEEHGKELSTLGETVGLSMEEYTHLQEFIDNSYSSSYWILIGDLCEWKMEGRDHNMFIKNWELSSQNMVQPDDKKRLIYSHLAGILNDDNSVLYHMAGFMNSNVAPTVGFAGNHDTASSSDIFNKMGLDADEIKHFNRLIMASMAFVHGGWFVTSGGEFYRKSSSVFTASPDDIDRDLIDNQDFVGDINLTLAGMPDFREEWKQTFFDPDQPDLLTVVLHEGFGFGDKADVVIINLSDEPREIDQGYIDDILSQSAARSNDPSQISSSVGELHLCGSISTKADVLAEDIYKNGIPHVNNFPHSDRSKSPEYRAH